MSAPLLLEGMRGLGDNLYQRAVVREVVKRRVVYLDTPWPQLFADLPVRCVAPRTELRTQAKNPARPYPWHAVPDLVDHQRWSYVNRPGTMLDALAREVGVTSDALDFSGPPVRQQWRQPYVVVRPVTRRAEWKSASREPRAEYIDRAAQTLRKRFRVISVADLAPPHEVAVPPLPEADECYHHGELNVESLMALVANAAGVVGGVGWLVPAAVAYQVPMLLVYGGCGFHNGPGRIFDTRMDTSRFIAAMPEDFCPCARAEHECSKSIAHFDRRVARFAETLPC